MPPCFVSGLPPLLLLLNTVMYNVTTPIRLMETLLVHIYLFGIFQNFASQRMKRGESDKQKLGVKEAKKLRRAAEFVVIFCHSQNIQS